MSLDIDFEAFNSHIDLRELLVQKGIKVRDEFTQKLVVIEDFSFHCELGRQYHTQHCELDSVVFLTVVNYVRNRQLRNFDEQNGDHLLANLSDGRVGILQ